MDKKERKKITGIGPVLFGKVTINTIVNAQDASQHLELPDKAHVFTAYIISGAVIKPEMEPYKVNLLPADVISELVSCVVSLLHIEEYYATVEEADIHLRFYKAFRNYESELFSRILNYLKPLFTPLNFQISSVAGSMSDFMVKHRERFRQIHENFETLSAKWRATLASVEKLNFASLFKDFAIQIKLREEATDAFRAASWPIAPSMPVELIERVVEMYKQGNTRYISRTILAYYQRNQKANLKVTVEGWSNNPFFSPRMRIIKDALWAHCEGLYTLSYPAILPQIEGIMRSYVHTNGLIKAGSNPKMAEIYNAVTDDYDISNWLIAATLLYHLQNNIYSYSGFEEELKKADASRSVTRNTVAHGIAYNYDSEMHSLKAFLMLDAISALPIPS